MTTADSPFRRGKDERQLGITIHAPTTPTSVAEDEALTLIRELVNLAEITFADTAAGARRQLKIEPADRAVYDTCPFTVYGESEVLTSLIFSPDEWTQCVDRHASPSPDRRQLLADVFVAAVHEALGHDLFVTTSPELLQLRDESDFVHLNICPPSEAVKIVGLFLRSRDEFVHTASPLGRSSVDSWSFYLVLTRTKLERLWARTNRWVEIGRTSHKEVGSLRGSIILRCRRAIEARDAIGVQFYRRQDNRTQDIILYHFDYLTLLLSGALDALMHVARVVYRVEIKPWDVGFWRPRFRKKLEQAAPELHALVTTDRRKALRHLLAAPRNTIHAERLHSMGFAKEGHPPVAVVKLDDKYGPDAWEAAEQLGGAERWGLLRFPGYPFEPYTYTHALLDECFRLLEDAFEIIEEPLLGTAPNHEPGPRAPELFTPDQVRRIGLLG